MTQRIPQIITRLGTECQVFTIQVLVVQRKKQEAEPEIAEVKMFMGFFFGSGQGKQNQE